MNHRRVVPQSFDRSAFAGFRFPPEVILFPVRWYLRYGLSYRDVEELLAERGIEVDHVTIYRWVQRFTPLLIDAARPHTLGTTPFEKSGKPMAVPPSACSIHDLLTDLPF